MTNLIKRKGLLTLMAVVVMVAMMSVACKNKVTASANLSAEAGTEEVINGAEVVVDNKDTVVDKDAVDNKDTADDTVKIVEGTFVSGDFKATVKNSEITIEYKDEYGRQGPFVIKAEGTTPIKAKNSRYGFNFTINGAKFLATDATPNYDANGKLATIVLSGYGQVKEVKF